MLGTLLLTSSMEEYAPTRARFGDVESGSATKVGSCRPPPSARHYCFFRSSLSWARRRRAYRGPPQPRSRRFEGTLGSREPNKGSRFRPPSRTAQTQAGQGQEGDSKAGRARWIWTSPAKRKSKACGTSDRHSPERIVADRDSFGPFGSMEGLTRVKGVGPSMVEKLDSAVTFSLVPRPTNTVISRPSELPKARRKPHRRDMRP